MTIVAFLNGKLKEVVEHGQIKFRDTTDPYKGGRFFLSEYGATYTLEFIANADKALRDKLQKGITHDAYKQLVVEKQFLHMVKRFCDDQCRAGREVTTPQNLPNAMAKEIDKPVLLRRLAARIDVVTPLKDTRVLLEASSDQVKLFYTKTLCQAIQLPLLSF